MMWRGAILSIGFVAACGGSAGKQDGGPGAIDGPPGIDAPPRFDATPGSCAAGTVGNRLGKHALLVGGGMDDTSFAAAPFTIRNIYLAGDTPDPGPCNRCDTGCTVDGASCANGGPGCNWWGCWQYDQDPPGRYAANFVTGAWAAGAVPMITYYVWFSVAGQIESMPEIDRLAEGARVKRYLADWKFLCQTVAAASTQPVILHVEPDLWGYAEQAGDPTAVPVALSAAGLSECAGEPDSLVGFAHCLVTIAHTHAPNALVGFHASAWGAGADALINTDPSFDLMGHADTTAAYLTSIGADQGDVIVVEMSDRDAGFNMRWWDKTNATLPSFTQALAWSKRVAQDLKIPQLWWQVPYGHEGLPDMCDQYQDNRAAYVFDHADELAASGSLGVSFGASAGCMTTPATDNGYFVGRATGFFTAGAPALCGP